ncbi:MAG: carbon-nitrogen hydrolase family protein [Promethearchaeota archaeon]
MANKFSVNIISGGIWEKRPHNESSESSNSKFWNFITSYLFNSKGQEIGRQDKIHLYNFEPIIFEPGSQLHIFSLEELDVKLAILICFDIAFYETPRAAVENGAEILISPTLIREEGLYNWNIYLQARALENRVPVAACNPIGDFFGRHFPGKSKIISFKVGSESPAVLKVKEAPKNQQFIISEKINLSFPNRIREKRLAEKIDIKKIIIKKK